MVTTVMACRNATILAAEPASLIRIDKALYRRTLYEMQVTCSVHYYMGILYLPSFQHSGEQGAEQRMPHKVQGLWGLHVLFNDLCYDSALTELM